ncbi:hypothetical protein R1sor_003861 [Riccia sorocarpa]|uniref:SWI/SNF-related matrix-associated actin-dependent regulator of chromatin subfamily A-like protein 1 n=1 Tax=Riccia sorocarpa TaxID=122646 RepID=A0ABD3H6T3_9MARC
MMGDDDEWNLSPEELDALEQTAATQLAAHKHVPSSAAAPTASTWDSPSKRVLPKYEVLGSPQKSIASLISTSPLKGARGIIPVKIFKDIPGRIACQAPYNSHLVEALKTVPARSWDASRKVWTYPEAGLDFLVNAIKSLSHLKLSIEIVPPLSVNPGVSDVSTADRIGSQEDEAEVWCTPPQALSSVQENHSDVLQSKSPRPCQVQSSLSVQGPNKSCYVKFFLHHCGKIAAKFEYDTEVVAALKKVPRAEYHAKERLWMFPISSIPKAEEVLKSIKDRVVTIEPLEPIVKRALEATATLPDLRERFDLVDEKLRKTLMEFQVEGVRFALQHGGRALIADEMGLGKTLQALAVVSCLQEEWPVLIIVPSSLRVHWANMVATWLNVCPSDITIVLSQGSCHGGFNVVRTSGKHKPLVNGLFNIVSYDALTKLEDIIMRTGFKIVIADESHYMKNPQAKRTNVCVPLLQKAKYSLLLTGTPALSRPIELFKQLQALQPTVYQKINEYGGRYCQGVSDYLPLAESLLFFCHNLCFEKLSGGSGVISLAADSILPQGFFGVWQGSSNREELHALVKSTVMIRRLKSDVLTQLPKKRREQIFMTLDEKGMNQIRALLHELDSVKTAMQAALKAGNKEEVMDMRAEERTLISKIYSETAEVKIPAVQEFLETMLEGGCKFLVFAHHQVMLDGIQEFLQKKKVKFIRIDGKTPAASRQELVKTFQEKEDVKVAVLGIRAAGVGLTLTAASTVIFAEMSWTPGDLVQAEDRAHRIGQESAVNVYYLHAHDTIDDFMWDAVQHKLENLGQVLDGQGDSTMQVASNKEVESGSQSQEQPTLHDFMKPVSKFSSNDNSEPGQKRAQSRASPVSSKRRRGPGRASRQYIDLTDELDMYPDPDFYDDDLIDLTGSSDMYEPGLQYDFAGQDY